MQDSGAADSICGSRRSLEEGNGNPFQYSCLENPMDRGSWQATVHEVAKELDVTEQLTLSLFSLWVLSLYHLFSLLLIDLSIFDLSYILPKVKILCSSLLSGSTYLALWFSPTSTILKCFPIQLLHLQVEVLYFRLLKVITHQVTWRLHEIM